MGWAKYHEDIIEVLTDSGCFDEVGNYKIKSTEPPVFNCNYCNLSFDSKNDLYEHIKKEHNVVSFILLVNGKIIHKECYVRELKSVKIVRYDLGNHIYVDKIHMQEYDSFNEVDITNKIYQDFYTNKSIIITIGEKEFKIYLIAQGNINVKKINDIISQWSVETSEGSHINKNYAAFNEIERKCLDGLYNYFIACVSTGKNKDLRYFDAYAILLEVASILPVATIVLKIIAFKFNWTEHLRVLCVGDDIFSSVYNFMINKVTEFTVNINGEKQIFIEDELEKTIQCIIAYQEKNYQKVEEFIREYSFRSITEIEDYYQRDRVCLLCARMALKNSKNHDARRYYDEIQSPFFDNEKKNYINVM